MKIYIVNYSLFSIKFSLQQNCTNRYTLKNSKFYFRKMVFEWVNAQKCLTLAVSKFDYGRSLNILDEAKVPIENTVSHICICNVFIYLPLFKFYLLSIYLIVFTMVYPNFLFAFAYSFANKGTISCCYLLHRYSTKRSSVKPAEKPWTLSTVQKEFNWRNVKLSGVNFGEINYR